MTEPETIRLLEPDGTCTVPRSELALTDGQLRDLLRWMILARRVDDAAIDLQTEGELTVYPPFCGQEAAQVGSMFALERQDFVFPTFREFAAALVRGIPASEYLEYHRGTWHGGPWDPMQYRFGPICITLATQIVHAVGFAMGQQLRRTGRVTLAYFGDGSASEGDFHEACNFAGVFEAPVVLFCQNNGIAISVPFERQAAAPIAARAAGYGFPGVRVDGNDVLAVWSATLEAAARARSGGGPTLIEAMTYRLGPHHTADDPSRYRDESEVRAAEELDPLKRYRAWMEAEHLASETDVAVMERDADEFVERMAAETRHLRPPGAEFLFEWVFGGPSIELLRQQADLSRFTEEPAPPPGHLRAVEGGLDG